MDGGSNDSGTHRAQERTWAEETVAAVVDAFDYLDAAYAVSAVDPDGITSRTVPEDDDRDRFEIGSISKTFTAALVALGVGDGILTLDDPIGTWCDAGPNADITVGQLATHTSGLPRLAPNHDGEHRDPADPYRDYTPDMAEAGLREATRAEVGTVEYSNFGYQLLGIIAERAFDLPFAELAKRELFAPLGMVDTAVTGTRPGRSVVGVDREGNPTSAWHMQLPSAGGFESTAIDMARYARTVLDPPNDRLRAALDLAVADHTGTGQGLAWHRVGPTIGHGGGTGGFQSQLSIALDDGRAAFGVVASASSLHRMYEAIEAAAAGKDLRDFRRVPADDRHHATASEAAILFATGDLDGFRALGADGFAEWFNDDLALPYWTSIVEPCGAYRSQKIRRADTIGDHNSVIVTLEFEHDVGDLELFLDDDSRLVGVRILA